jgi:hypothetical protein
MRAAIRKVPDGIYRQTALSDGLAEPIRLEMSLTVKGDSIAIDYTGSAPQVLRAINVCMAYTIAYTSFGVKAVLAPGIPNNEGVLRPVRITAPHGSICNSKPPAAGGGNQSGSGRDQPREQQHRAQQWFAHGGTGTRHDAVPQPDAAVAAIDSMDGDDMGMPDARGGATLGDDLVRHVLSEVHSARRLVRFVSRPCLKRSFSGRRERLTVALGWAENSTPSSESADHVKK